MIRNYYARWVLLPLGLLVALPPAAVAGPPEGPAAATEVSWFGETCREVVALVPTDAFEPGATLVVLAYECRDATVDGSPVDGGIRVSEISVRRADGTWTLLRQVVDHAALAKRLRALGLQDSALGEVELAVTGGPAAVDLAVDVGLPTARYAMSGSSVRPGDPLPSSGGASYTYEGPRGTVRVSYENHAQSVNAADVTVDASSDPELRAWLGGRDSATAPGMFALGSWSGRATLVP